MHWSAKNYFTERALCILINHLSFRHLFNYKRILDNGKKDQYCLRFHFQVVLQIPCLITCADFFSTFGSFDNHFLMSKQVFFWLHFCCWLRLFRTIFVQPFVVFESFKNSRTWQHYPQKPTLKLKTFRWRFFYFHKEFVINTLPYLYVGMIPRQQYHL